MPTQPQPPHIRPRHPSALGLPATLALLAALALGGCASTGPDLGDLRARLERERRAWEALDIQDYRYDVRQSCFCGWVRPVHVTVVDDAIAEVRDAETDEPVDEELFPQYYTVDALFDLVEWALDHDADRIEVDYHPMLHFPVRIVIDGRFNTADDENEVVASSLVPLTAE